MPSPSLLSVTRLLLAKLAVFRKGYPPTASCRTASVTYLSSGSWRIANEHCKRVSSDWIFKNPLNYDFERWFRVQTRRYYGACWRQSGSKHCYSKARRPHRWLVSGYRDNLVRSMKVAASVIESSMVYKSYLTCAAKIIKSDNGDRIMAVFIGKSKNTTAARSALKINGAVKTIINP